MSRPVHLVLELAGVELLKLDVGDLLEALLDERTDVVEYAWQLPTAGRLRLVARIFDTPKPPPTSDH